MDTNFALANNPNKFLSRSAAVEYLVDACINGCETEWANASVRMVGMGYKTKSDALKDIREVASIVDVYVNDDMLYEAYEVIEANLI